MKKTVTHESHWTCVRSKEEGGLACYPYSKDVGNIKKDKEQLIMKNHSAIPKEQN